MLTLTDLSYFSPHNVTHVTQYHLPARSKKSPGYAIKSSLKELMKKLKLFGFSSIMHSGCLKNLLKIFNF